MNPGEAQKILTDLMKIYKMIETQQPLVALKYTEELYHFVNQKEE
jgi:hypothetical protein